MRRLMRIWLALALLAGVLPAIAAEGPDGLARGITEQVLGEAAADPAIRAGDRERAMRMIEERVVPHFDFARMTALAMGRDWRAATAEQREALTGEFRTLLVRTYANALTQYKGQKLVFRASRVRPEDVDALVHAEFRSPGSPAVQVDFAMERSGDTWKVYDVQVAGVSLITNYRATFAQRVRDDGIDGLIALLRDKNRTAGVEKS